MMRNRRACSEASALSITKIEARIPKEMSFDRIHSGRAHRALQPAAAVGTEELLEEAYPLTHDANH